MVPDKFNMVDMGGIDLIMAQGEEVSGLYNRLVESIAQCRYQCLYNWFFDGVLIPPSYVEMEVNEDDEVAINEGVTVSSDDVIHIYSLDPGPVDPEIIPLLAEENGVYNVPAGKDGFNPVTVNVPSYTPVIDPITIIENGTYNAPSGVDGYSPVTVNVSGGSLGLSYPSSTYVGYINPFGQGANDWLGFNSGSAGWLLMVFDEAVKISSVVFNNTFATGSYHWSTGKVSLEYSDDGANWVFLNEISNLTDDVTNRYTLSISNSGNHKWYRLNVYPNGTLWPGIGKVVINY